MMHFKWTWKWIELQRTFLPIVLMGFFFGLAGCRDSLSPDINKTQLLDSPAVNANTGKIIRYAVFPAPPYMIGAGDEKSAMSGIDVEIVQEIARRLNLSITFIKCTWARCLDLMNNGEADLLSSAYKKPDREEYMLYLDEPFLQELPITFYYLKNKNIKVTAYEDIYQFESLGVLRGAAYFDPFDQDLKVKKFEVPSQDQLFPMLLAGRLDAIAGYLPTENYHIQEAGFGSQIERSAYEYHEKALVYMTISKKSALSSRLKEINQINHQLLTDGYIARIINTYYEKYR